VSEKMSGTLKCRRERRQQFSRKHKKNLFACRLYTYYVYVYKIRIRKNLKVKEVKIEGGPACGWCHLLYEYR